MNAKPRIAFFTDSYAEVNGVAHTSRMLAAFAKRRELPFLCVHAGSPDRETGRLNPNATVITDGSLQRLALPRSRFGFKLDSDLHFDLLMMRHARLALETVRAFNPDVIHITGPSDIGLLGLYVARRLKLPIVMSWHTNVHEYASRRLKKLLPYLPDVRRFSLAGAAEKLSLKLTLLFYKFGKVFLAPNNELAELLRQTINRPVMLMRRGVDTTLFSRAKRRRSDDIFTIGYVGRLTPEKNVRLLAELEKGVRAAGAKEFRFVIVGDGSERDWLRQHMQTAQFPGVLKGEALARAYANFDVFIFPSRTDTFGNVVLEAQASGVPAIVSNQGGPKFIVCDEETGIVAASKRQFLNATLNLMAQPQLRRQMGEAARELACQTTWDNVFEQVWLAYELCVQRAAAERAVRNPLSPTTARSNAIS